MHNKTSGTWIGLGILAVLAVISYRFSSSRDHGSGGQQTVAFSDPSKSKTVERSARARLLAARIVKEEDSSAQPGLEPGSSSAASVDSDVALREGLRASIRVNKDALRLTRDEENQLIEDHLLIEDVRALLEARLVKTISHADGMLVLGIPAYPEAGGMLKELFREQLREDFAPEKTAAINACLGDYFDSASHYFGAMNQTLHVVSGPDQSTMIYWQAERDGPVEVVPGRVLSATGTTVLTAKDLDGPRYDYIKRALAAAELHSK